MDNQNLNVLDEINKGATMGMDAISFISQKVEDNQFKNILKGCNLPQVTFHSLRHSFATLCIENGLDSKALSEILGHSSIKITLDIYVHSNMAQKKEYLNRLSI